MILTKKKSVYTILKSICFGIKICFLASKFYFLMKLIILLSTTAVPLVNTWLWKEVLNGVASFSNHQQNVFLCLVFYLILNTSAYLLNQFDNYVSSRYSDAIRFYIDVKMMEKTARMDMCFFDSAKMADKVRNARNNFEIAMQMTWLVFDVISMFINTVASFIIVCTYKWWVGVVTLLILIPFLMYNKRRADHKFYMEKQQIRDIRKKDYYRDVFFDNNIQFEIKLNDIGTYFIKKHRTKWENLYNINKKEEIKYNIINTLFVIINLLSEFIMLTISIFDVIAQNIGIGDLQYNLSMVSRLRNQAQSLINRINIFLNNNIRLTELQEFLNMKPVVEQSGNISPTCNPKVEFCNVSFRYPNTEQYILKDCSFIINPNEKIGIIGLNGSGKSTIIKLLFRFYDPEKGCIKLDGVDLKEYDVYAVRRVFGVLFQDYVRYCLPIREIISLPEFSERFNDAKLIKACELSGANEIFKDWEHRFDTVIGRYYSDEGKELSGGQWQLVSLARAYFKDCKYIILDEPSASLDPISEYAIFEQLYALSTDKTSITISHRLSNTVLADRILVLQNGHIIEQGSHEELLAMRGIYARLFNLQAHNYNT